MLKISDTHFSSHQNKNVKIIDNSCHIQIIYQVYIKRFLSFKRSLCYHYQTLTLCFNLILDRGRHWGVLFIYRGFTPPIKLRYSYLQMYLQRSEIVISEVLRLHHPRVHVQCTVAPDKFLRLFFLCMENAEILLRCAIQTFFVRRIISEGRCGFFTRIICCLNSNSTCG